jgi:hypothetical protein
VTIRGSVDRLTPDGAQGWAFDGRDGQKLTLHALYDGRIIGEVVAELHRHDLAEAGFGDGCCGFEMAFYAPLDPALLPFVSIRPAGGDVELPRYAATGFAEFFRSLHARHPSAGRSRSVLGGLWTDRTDAKALLAGRIAAGTLPADLAATLGALVEDGHVLLRHALAAGGIGEAEREMLAAATPGQPVPAGEPALARLAETIFRDATLRPLRAALDDLPSCSRILPVAGTEHGFTQASTAEALPSPAECLAVVAVAGGEAVVEVIRDSHRLPEFTAEGRSRWLHGGAATLDLAIAQGLSVERVALAPADLLILGPGTLHRLAVAEGAVALRAFVLPRRVTPLRLLTATPRPAGAALLAA